MTYVIDRLTAHERMSVKKLLNRRTVAKTQPVSTQLPVEETGHYGQSEPQDRQPSGAQAYRAVDQLPRRPGVLRAGQVMTAQVVTVSPDTTISEGLRLFEDNAFRHMPVVSSEGALVGMVSERDMLRYLAGLTVGDQGPVAPDGRASIARAMTPTVLTVGVPTDVRYVARLFVEQRTGAIPVVEEGVLEGIITRSDVLGAVMRHYVLELWA